MLFENMGITYLGPVDGHDIIGLIEGVFKEAQKLDHAVLVHVLTKKEKVTSRRRKIRRIPRVEPFDIKTGKPAEKKYPTYTDVFSKNCASWRRIRSW